MSFPVTCQFEGCCKTAERYILGWGGGHYSVAYFCPFHAEVNSTCGFLLGQNRQPILDRLDREPVPLYIGRLLRDHPKLWTHACGQFGVDAPVAIYTREKLPRPKLWGFIPARPRRDHIGLLKFSAHEITLDVFGRDYLYLAENFAKDIQGATGRTVGITVASETPHTEYLPGDGS